jgi:hypothetical protein
MAHMIDIIFDDVTAPVISSYFDKREFNNLSFQVMGLQPGDEIEVYGSLFEKRHNAVLPIKFNNSYVLTENSIYILPPYYRFYEFRLTKKLSAIPVRAYLYSITDGTFQTESASSGSGSTEPAIMSEQSVSASAVPITDTIETVAGSTLSIPIGGILWIKGVQASLLGSGAYLEWVYRSSTGVESVIYTLSLTTFYPTHANPFEDNIKIARDALLTGDVFVRARGYCQENTIGVRYTAVLTES